VCLLNQSPSLNCYKGNVRISIFPRSDDVDDSLHDNYDDDDDYYDVDVL